MVSHTDLCGLVSGLLLLLLGYSSSFECLWVMQSGQAGCTPGRATIPEAPKTLVCLPGNQQLTIICVSSTGAYLFYKSNARKTQHPLTLDNH